MKTLKITAKDVKRSTSYWSDYIGKEDLSYFDGHVEIDNNLGWVRFDSISVTGHLWAGSGTGIEADYSIGAGNSIEAGYGIKAGDGIEAGYGIETGLGIEAGLGIKAGWGIKASGGIEAGLGIKAGWGIKAGFSITCRQNIYAGYRIFAGTSTWVEDISDEDKTITCGKLEHGEVAYGILKETWLPDEELDIIELNGKRYREIKEEL